MSREQLEAALQKVAELLPLPTGSDEVQNRGDLGWRAELVERYATVRPFLEQLATVVSWGRPWRSRKSSPR